MQKKNEQNNSIAENKMGVMPVSKLLITMSLPMVISMLVQAMYNIVDSVFVARLSDNALTAVSLAFPVQNIMIGVGSGVAVGVNALLSKSLGEKNIDEANKIAKNGVFMSLIAYLIFLFFGIFGTTLFFNSQNSKGEISSEAISMGITYLTICCVSSFGLFGQFIFERIMQSTGRTFYTMITQGIGAIINIILDPILIFGLLGFPKMGIAGAAVATVIGQIAAMIIAIILNHKKNIEINLDFKGFRPSTARLMKILKIGFPSMLVVSIGSIMTFGVNNILLKFSQTAVNVFGAYFKLQSFIFMPVFALNNGMIPIFSYNYGALNKKRMMQTYKLSSIYAVAIMLVGLVIMQIFPVQLLSLFNPSQEMTDIGTSALRIISLSFMFAGYCIITTSMFQALNKGLYAIIVSAARQLILILPIAYLFSLSGNVNLVWWAFPLAELGSLTLSTIFLYIVNKQVISKLPSTVS